jgi:hypothetical protein
MFEYVSAGPLASNIRPVESGNHDIHHGIIFFPSAYREGGFVYMNQVLIIAEGVYPRL